MKLIEMIIDEMEDAFGVNAISVVENPAIESDFVALESQFEQRVELAEVDKEKRILLGAALIPDKPIYRKDEGAGYYIYFKKETVRKTMELFMRRQRLDSATENHKGKVEGLHIVESWIVEDSEKDKSAVHGLKLPVGTWCVSYKCDNAEIYEKAKAGKLKGFSIEGNYQASPKTQLSLDKEKLKEFKELHQLADEAGMNQTYDDYPQKAQRNAKRALKYAQENHLTKINETPCYELSEKVAINADEVVKMAMQIKNQSVKTKTYDDGIDKVIWDSYGGQEGIEWATRKINEA